MTEDTPEPAGPWTVKGIPQEDRTAINAAARRANMTVGEWLRSAALLKIHTERQPPGMPVPAEDRGIPTAYRPPAPASLDVVVQLATVLPGLTEAKGSSRLAGRVRKVMEQHLAALAASPPAGPPRLGAPEGD